MSVVNIGNGCFNVKLIVKFISKAISWSNIIQDPIWKNMISRRITPPIMVTNKK